MATKGNDKPKVPDYGNFFGAEFAKGARRRQFVKHLIDKLTEEKKELDATIGGLMEVNDLKSVMVGDNTVTLCQGTSTHLSKTRLMELGVLADVIEQATKRTHYPYVQIREGTEKK